MSKLVPKLVKTGGKGGIRTHGSPKRTPTFQAGRLNHSLTFPSG